jgi:hypothetical protein
MIVDWSNIIQIVLGVAISAISYAYTQLKTKVEKNHEDILNYKLHVSESYVSVAELTKAVDALTKGIDTVAAGVLRIEGRQLGNSLTDRRAS